MEPSLTPSRTPLKIFNRKQATLELVEIQSLEGNRIVPVIWSEGVPHVFYPTINPAAKRLEALRLHEENPLYLALVKPGETEAKPKKSKASEGEFVDL